MPTETLTKKEPTPQIPMAPQEDELRERARKRVERVRGVKENVAL